MFDVKNYITDISYKVEDYGGFNYEYTDLYKNFELKELIEIFSTLHHIFVSEYKEMNSRIKKRNSHFLAQSSRNLIFAIEIAEGMKRSLKNTEYDFALDEYYKNVIEKSNGFLSSINGSEIPSDMEEVINYYTIPIFIKNNSVQIDTEQNKYYNLKPIGFGSYAEVYSFKDIYYNKKMALKRAMKDLNEKEIQRFRREYEIMKSLSSPHIVEVYRFDERKLEYIMEYVDMTLYKFMEKNNSNISIESRIHLVRQIFSAFKYIHSKNFLHRDIAPTNILIKFYEDVNIVKISDFGLVKLLDSTLTEFDTELKGSFIDPILKDGRFGEYNIFNEIYSLTRVVYYIMTGKLKFNLQSINNEKFRDFISKGIDMNIEKRYKSVDEMSVAFNNIWKNENN